MFRIFIALVVVSALPSPVMAQPTLVSIIEIRRTMGPGELIDFVFVDLASGVTQESVGDPDGDDLISISVPTIASAYVHDDPCASLCLSYLTAGSGTTAGLVPLLADETGLALLPGFSVSDLDQMPSLTVGQTFEVVDGVAAEFAVALIRAPSVPFDQIPLSQWADTSVFPLFTGTASVSELLNTTVIIRCAADFDSDGEVRVDDLLDLLAAWNTPAADIDGNGNTDVLDLLELLAAWGACP
ncbi:MAG: hypothetical protein O7G85_07690 [Planctomycetota bacterium]|nr:hypothetical protein [Planctomycetota bacterium]